MLKPERKLDALLITQKTVTMVLDGEHFNSTYEDAEKSGALLALANKNYERAAELINKAKAIVRRSLGAFTLENGTIFFKGQTVHNTAATRIVEFINKGLPFMSIVAFLENILQNPSKRATDEGYEFLEHKHLPLTEDGCFMAYKTVGPDYLSKTSGKEPVDVSTDGGRTWKTFTGKIPNKIGSIVKIQRNLVDDDRTRECSYGLHVGALAYAGPNGTFHSQGDKCVVVKVNPRDIVAVPKDYDAQKMRVSRYEVLKDYQAAYEAPLTSASGEELRNREIYCNPSLGGCEWEGYYTDLTKGDVGFNRGQIEGRFRCPECDSNDTLDAF